MEEIPISEAEHPIHAEIYHPLKDTEGKTVQMSKVN